VLQIAQLSIYKSLDATKVKSLLLFIWILQSSLVLFSQGEYFVNSVGDKVSKDKAIYKRTVQKLDKDYWEVSDYYLDGTLQMTGFYKDKKLTVETDSFTWYYINGQIQSKRAYNHGKENGTFESYYFNGKKRILGQYKNGEKHGKWFYWAFDETLRKELVYFNDKPSGTWIWYDSTGREHYRLTEASEATVDSLYQPAKLKNGMSFSEYLSTMEYPKDVLEENIIGATHIEFAIDKDGSVKDIDVIVPSDKRLTAAAIEHIMNMPECTPAKEFNKNVKKYYIIPIKFSFKTESYELSEELKASFYYNSGLEAAKSNDIKRAIRRLQYAVIIDPVDVDLNYLLGLLYHLSNDLPNACKYWTMAYSLQPEKLDEEKKKICGIKE
jgi:antitoxin component YwqK of YwqJK toxin-antitoxin module